MALHIAMVAPPISDLNTIYSAAPRLTGWLRQLGHKVTQIDLSLELFLRIYSRRGLERMFAAVQPDRITLDLEDTFHQRDRYIRIIDEVIAFTQGRDLSPVHRIVRGDYLPEGPRFRREGHSHRRAAFGQWGRADLARHMVALMLTDLADLFRATVTPHYFLTNYGESLAESRSSFDPIEAELLRSPNVVEEMMYEAAVEAIPDDVDLVCMTCPFPGNLLCSLMLGKWLATHRPRARRALGGGYPSTELRQVTDPRLFEYIDFLSLDDGEVPLQQICDRLQGKDVALERTFTREGDRVVYHKMADGTAPRFRDLPTPDYDGVPLGRYVHVLYRRNHVSRLLSEGTWLKLTAAHGCYWKKCTFCDIHLSYIGDFDPLPAARLADQMDAMHRQTGISGFHFTDEAAPPPLLLKLALELLRRGRAYQFWGNVRFDPGFTLERCRVLAAAGMVAVTGGIEIASDTLLPQIAKGITVRQVIKVLQAFSQAGILNHAYLIYGFPGETLQDTINSLELLRQMMRARILQSAYYHKFSATLHSPIGRTPERFGLRVLGPTPKGFAHYNLEYELTGPDPRSEAIFTTLQNAMDAFARGDRLDHDVMEWFRGQDFPSPSVPSDLVQTVLSAPPPPVKATSQVLWLGGTPRWERGMLTVSEESGEIFSLRAPRQVAQNLLRCTPSGWTGDAPPTPGDFPSMDWAAPFWTRGLLAI